MPFGSSDWEKIWPYKIPPNISKIALTVVGMHKCDGSKSKWLLTSEWLCRVYKYCENSWNIIRGRPAKHKKDVGFPHSNSSLRIRIHRHYNHHINFSSTFHCLPKDRIVALTDCDSHNDKGVETLHFASDSRACTWYLVPIVLLVLMMNGNNEITNSNGCKYLARVPCYEILTSVDVCVMWWHWTQKQDLVW